MACIKNAAVVPMNFPRNTVGIELVERGKRARIGPRAHLDASNIAKALFNLADDQGPVKFDRHKRVSVGGIAGDPVEYSKLGCPALGGTIEGGHSQCRRRIVRGTVETRVTKVGTDAVRSIQEESGCLLNIEGGVDIH